MDHSEHQKAAILKPVTLF